jgi:outer membrane receptor protein involved in Fe transport
MSGKYLKAVTARLFTAAMFICFLCGGAWTDADRVWDFNIPRQNVVSALTALTEKTGTQLLFPYEKVRSQQANPLIGRYTLARALEILLHGTGLSGGVTGSGVITISLDPSTTTSREPGDSMNTTTNKKNDLFAGLAAAVISVFATNGAVAQTPEAAQAMTRGLEEIVVTAQRREASLQEVALSVRAVTSEELLRVGATGIEDYASLVPGLNLIQQGGPGRTQIEMRGVTVGNMRDDRPEFRPTVGVYLDDAPIAAQTINANIALMDLERIEVMRGPQATLYGAGSLSGTIRMISAKPKLDEYSGQVRAGGSFTEHGGGNYEFSGIFNAPLIENELGLRAVGFYRDEAGYIDSPLLGEENTNDNQDIGGRVALRYEPTDFFRLDASIGYQETDIDSLFEYYEEAGELNTQNAMPTPHDAHNLVASLVAEVDFGAATLTSATSYFGANAKFYQDGSVFTDFITGVFPDPFLVAFSTFYDLDEFTEELRLVSNDEGNVTWIGGVLFQQQNHDFGQDMPVPGIDDFSGLPSEDFQSQPDNVYRSRIDIETTQLSLFGEASIKLFDRLTLKGGLRWFYAAQDSTVFFAGPLAFPNIGTSAAESSENGVNPTVNVSWQFDEDRMIYVQAARGFRLGGINQPIPDALCGADLIAAGFTDPQPSFKSDNLWNYEIGTKTSWFDDRLRVNASGYLIDWEDPAYVVGFACGFSLIVNAGQFDITGFELDAEAELAEGLVSRLGLSYTDSQLGEDVPLINGVDGDRTPYSPQFTLSASVDYDFPIGLFGGGYMGFVHGDVRWVDERITRIPGDPKDSTGWGGLFNLAAYGEGNLRAGVYSDAWRLELYVQNLWDERPELSKRTWPYSEFPGTPIVTLRPRTFGIQVSRNF